MDIDYQLILNCLKILSCWANSPFSNSYNFFLSFYYLSFCFSNILGLGFQTGISEPILSILKGCERLQSVLLIYFVLNHN